MCGYRNYPYTDQGGLLEIPVGRGPQKPKLFKESMKYSGDGDSIKPSKDGFRYFLELHHRIPLYDEQSLRNKT